MSVVVALGLALLLAVGSWVTSTTRRPPAPSPTPPAAASPVPPVPSRPAASRAAVPRRGTAYPVRELGGLRGRSVIVSGRGRADLRYRRAPGNGTRLHLICTGCDADTWIAEWPRGAAVGGGPLSSPADTTWAVDTVAAGRSTSLVLEAAADAEWTLTLTPFDEVPVHPQTFDALDADVVAVRTAGDLQLRCPGPSSVRTLYRPRGAPEYAVGALQRQPQGGTARVAAPRDGTGVLILAVGCAGRWTLTVP